MINFVSDCRIGLCKVFYKSETTHSQINSTIVMDDIPMSFSRHLTSSVFFFFFFLANFHIVVTNVFGKLWGKNKFNVDSEKLDTNLELFT
jgi:hypothetical protein